MFLQVAKEDREEFREILRELLAEGKLTLTVKGKYMKSNGKVLTGTFISNAKGFGFVEVEGRDEDLFPEDKQGGAFHKDTAEKSGTSACKDRQTAGSAGHSYQCQGNDPGGGNL